MLVLLMYYKHEQTEHEKRCFRYDRPDASSLRIRQGASFSPPISPPREYREVSRLTARLSLRLRDLLPDDDWNTVEKYEDAAAQLHSMELEAAFQAAFSLARELP